MYIWCLTSYVIVHSDNVVAVRNHHNTQGLAHHGTRVITDCVFNGTY